MAAETKTSVAARFANHAYVSAADFSTLIDSYQDAHSVLLAISTAAQAGSKGMVYVSGSATVTFQSAAAQGLRLLNTATTAAAQQQLGGGTVGRVVFEAATTAASQQQLGGGTVGRTLFETTTTAAAQAIIGSVSAATQAEAEAVAANGVVITPLNAKWLPQVAKAWAAVSAGADPVQILASHNVASVSAIATGKFNIVFSTPMSTANYAIHGTVSHNGGLRFFSTNSALSVSAGGFQTRMSDTAGSDATPERFHILVFGDF